MVGKPPLSVRRANVSDAPGIAAVRIASWRAGYRDLMRADFLDGLDETRDALRFSKWLSSPEVEGFVAEEDGNVVGFTLLRPARDEDCAPAVGEIPTFYVAPEYWRRGVGRSLWKVTMDRANDREMSAVCLWVIEGNDRARRFYESVGFRPDGKTKVDVGLVGAPLHEVRYCRQLGGMAQITAHGI